MKRMWCAAAAIIFAGAFWGTARADVSHLVISQVQVGMSGNSNDEFIEIYNPTSASVDLSALPLKLHIRNSAGTDNNKILTFTNSVIISRGYFLIGPATGYSGTTTLDATYLTSGNMLVSNGGVYISASSTLDATQAIDKLGWGTQPAGGFEGTAVTSSSATLVLARKFTNGAAIDADDNSLDFVLASANPHNSGSAAPLDLNIPVQAAPQGSPATSTYSTTVKISEVLPNPVGSDDGNEAIELFNSGTSTVDLSGWLFSDNHGIGSAYPLPASTTIAAGGYLAIVIPAGNFSLTNTGDTANFYYPDQSLADSVTYNDSAPEGWGYQIVSGNWMWGPATLGLPNAAPPPSASGGGGSATGSSYSSDNYNVLGSPNADSIRITEFLPNPLSGRQWVELYNAGTATASLAGWKLDNKGAGDGLLSSGAYSLGGAAVGPKNYFIANIPSGKSVLSVNGDVLRLFRPDNSLAQSVAYSQAPAGQSYGLGQDDKWVYGLPTPGAANQPDMAVPEIFISELLPNPAGDDDEFIELYNFSTTTAVDLKNFKLFIGSREKVFDETVLATTSYLTLYEDDLPVKLRDGGQIIKLVDTFGREVSEAGYDKAAKGQAWAWTGSGYAWTEQPTPSADNQLVLAAATVEPVNLLAHPAVKKTSAGQINTEASKQLEQKVAMLEGEVADLQKQVAQEQAVSTSAPAAFADAQPVPPARDFTGNLALILSGLALLIILLKYFWPSGSKS